MPNITPYVIMSLFIVYIALFFRKYFKSRSDLPSPEYLELPVKLGFPVRMYTMNRHDALPLALITGVYAIVGFWGLGDRVVPETRYAHEGGTYMELQFREPVFISNIVYYSGIITGSYSVESSQDGVEWSEHTAMEQTYGDVLRWNDYKDQFTQTIRYLRISSETNLDLTELGIYDSDGDLVPVDGIIIPEKMRTLFDEQDIIKEYSYMNSTYFDEIYHARTAYEHILGVWPYEISHPPLGKLIISLGIRAFGLNPFGWRFMGALFGVLMLPALYVFLKNLFGKTAIAAAGTLLLAADFMHFTQTRIATIDTYAVFFTLLMYLFMYRFVATDSDSPFVPKYRPVLNLFLSGVCFGLGAASKWVVIYGLLGLALMWLLHWFFRGRDMIGAGRGRKFARGLFVNIALCIVFFIIIPCAIYYASYYPYGIGYGLQGGFEMYFSREYFDLAFSNQGFMLNYHVGVESDHPYASAWYMWLVNARPILYYLDWGDPKSAFGAFLNPLICWAGFVAMAAMAVRVFRHRDGRALFIAIGYLSQLLPWVLVRRETFAYHYFPSLIFLILALCHIFKTLEHREPWVWKKWVYSFSGLAALLFVVFYPVLSGAYVPRFYTESFVKWLPSWPF